MTTASEILVWNQPFSSTSARDRRTPAVRSGTFHKLARPRHGDCFLDYPIASIARIAHLDVDDLTINGLGLAADRPLKKRKYDLTRCIETLLSIGSSRSAGARPPAPVLQAEKGRYVVVFEKGPYFEKAIVTGDRGKNVKNDPLYGLMQAIGIDEPMIGKVLSAPAERDRNAG